MATLWPTPAIHSCGLHMQDIVRTNIEWNAKIIAAAGGSAHACELVWGITHAADLSPQWAAPDVVVAADVVYRRELFQPLLHALAELCAPPTPLHVLMTALQAA